MTNTHVVPFDQTESLVAMFYRQAGVLHDRPFLWAKEEGGHYTSRSWAEVARDVTACAYGLTASGIGPGDRVVIVSENRPE